MNLSPVNKTLNTTWSIWKCDYDISLTLLTSPWQWRKCRIERNQQCFYFLFFQESWFFSTKKAKNSFQQHFIAYLVQKLVLKTKWILQYLLFYFPSAIQAKHKKLLIRYFINTRYVSHASNFFKFFVNPPQIQQNILFIMTLLWIPRKYSCC